MNELHFIENSTVGWLPELQLEFFDELPKPKKVKSSFTSEKLIEHSEFLFQQLTTRTASSNIFNMLETDFVNPQGFGDLPKPPKTGSSSTVTLG